MHPSLPRVIHVIIGTKAQLVKMAPVIKRLQDESVTFRLILTGQHQETLDDLIKCFGLNPAHDVLFTKFESNSSFKLIRWITGCSVTLFKERRQYSDSAAIVVHGDTLSTLLAALFGRLIKKPVVHIEAGLRSFQLFKPFPEEIIRIMVTRLSTHLYCPNDWAKNNIPKKYLSSKTVVSTQHNTLLDSLRVAFKSQGSGHSNEPYLIVSIHRVENVMNLRALNHMIDVITETSGVIKLKFVLHGVTRKQLHKHNKHYFLEKNPRIELTDRMDYVKFIGLISNSRGIITDGGSNQEEAAYLGVPCLVFREETERTEGLDQNVQLSKMSKAATLEFAHQCCTKAWQPQQLPSHSPSDQIVSQLMQLLPEHELAA